MNSFVYFLFHSRHKTEMDKFKETEGFARFLQESEWDFGHCDDDAVIVVSLNYRKVCVKVYIITIGQSI